MEFPITKKLLRTLNNVRMETDNPLGMYPGGRYDFAPAQHGKLELMGLIELFIPHNPAHRERVTITESGRAALEENGIKEQ